MHSKLVSIAIAAALLAVSAPATHADQQIELRTRAPQGHTMAGEVLLPDGDGPHPVVLLISGTGRQTRDFEAFEGRYHPHRDIAAALLHEGIGVVRFDERNTGASGGDHRTARSADLRADISAILDAAKAQPGVDPKRIYIFGHSEGSVFAQQLSIERSDIAGLILVGAPAKSGREMTRDQVRIETPRPAGMGDPEFETVLAKAYDEEIAFMQSRPSLADLLDLNALALGRRVKAPVLILEAAEDWQVRPPQGEQLAAAIREGGAQVVYRRLERVGHLMTDNPPGVTDYTKLQDYAVSPAVLSALVTWVKAQDAR